MSSPWNVSKKINQSSQVCKTINIKEAKNLRTQSSYLQNAPRDLHWQIAKIVQSNWAPPLKYNSLVIITFRVLNNGTVSNIKIKTSPNSAADNAALKAIKAIKVNSFSNTKIPYVDIQYQFIVENNN